ncbi:MAG TPA: hypothetical protein VEB21_02100 [Terriglobales bacterium]|nr:hypothetical protein [Terriglobales bacterium]
MAKRLYITKLETWRDNLNLFRPTPGSHWIPLMDVTAVEDEVAAEFIHWKLKRKDAGPLENAELTAWHSAGCPILVVADFVTEDAEEAWTGNPDVALLPDPVFEGNVRIKDKVGDQVKKIAADHLSALKKHPALGFDEATDTVLDLSRKAARINPLVRVRHLL